VEFHFLLELLFLFHPLFWYFCRINKGKRYSVAKILCQNINTKTIASNIAEIPNQINSLK
jgi:hypothetical protein